MSRTPSIYYRSELSQNLSQFNYAMSEEGIQSKLADRKLDGPMYNTTYTAPLAPHLVWQLAEDPVVIRDLHSLIITIVDKFADLQQEQQEAELTLLKDAARFGPLLQTLASYVCCESIRAVALGFPSYRNLVEQLAHAMNITDDPPDEVLQVVFALTFRASSRDSKKFSWKGIIQPIIKLFLRERVVQTRRVLVAGILANIVRCDSIARGQVEAHDDHARVQQKAVELALKHSETSMRLFAIQIVCACDNGLYSLNNCDWSYSEVFKKVAEICVSSTFHQYVGGILLCDIVQDCLADILNAAPSSSADRALNTLLEWQPGYGSARGDSQVYTAQQNPTFVVHVLDTLVIYRHTDDVVASILSIFARVLCPRCPSIRGLFVSAMGQRQGLLCEFAMRAHSRLAENAIALLAMVLEDGTNIPFVLVSELVLHITKQKHGSENMFKFLRQLITRYPKARELCSYESVFMHTRAQQALKQHNICLFQAIIEIGISMPEAKQKPFRELLFGRESIKLVARSMASHSSSNEVTAALELTTRLLADGEKEATDASEWRKIKASLSEQILVENTLKQEAMNKVEAERTEVEKSLQSCRMEMENQTKQAQNQKIEHDLAFKRVNRTLHACTQELVNQGNLLTEMKSLSAAYDEERQRSALLSREVSQLKQELAESNVNLHVAAMEDNSADSVLRYEVERLKTEVKTLSQSKIDLENRLRRSYEDLQLSRIPGTEV